MEQGEENKVRRFDETVRTNEEEMILAVHYWAYMHTNVDIFEGDSINGALVKRDSKSSAGVSLENKFPVLFVEFSEVHVSLADAKGKKATWIPFYPLYTLTFNSEVLRNYLISMQECKNDFDKMTQPKWSRTNSERKL